MQNLPCNVWAQPSLGFQLIIGEAAGYWRSFLFPWLESWARVHPAPASPQEVSRPDDPPLPPPALCLLRAEGQPACSLVNKQSVQAALSGLLAAH